MNNTYLFGLSNTGSQSLDGLKPSDAALLSINNSLKISGVDLSEVDFLISASTTPDFNNPSLAQSILGQLGNTHIGGMEIRQSAAGFHFALDLAVNLTGSGIYKCILIACTEFLKRSYLSKNKENSDLLLQASEEISSDAVFSCLVCNQEFFNSKKPESTAYAVKQVAIYSNEEGFESFKTDIPSSSQFPERITLENVKSNLHLARLDKKLFLDKVLALTAKSLDEFEVKACDYFISHDPSGSSAGGYQGSAGIGNELLKLQNTESLKAGQVIATFAAGAGLNWGICKLESV